MGFHLDKIVLSACGPEASIGGPDCRVIIELRSRLTSGIDYGSRTHDRIGDQRIAAGPESRIQVSLERIDIVVRN
jgi:hypothetical protein